MQIEPFVGEIIGKPSGMYGLSPSDNGHIPIIDHSISIQISVADMSRLDFVPVRSIGRQIRFEGICSCRRDIEILDLIYSVKDIPKKHPCRISDSGCIQVSCILPNSHWGEHRMLVSGQPDNLIAVKTNVKTGYPRKLLVPYIGRFQGKLKSLIAQ